MTRLVQFSLLSLLLLQLTNAQDFQLFFGTRPTEGPTATPVCADKVDNCGQYGADACHGQYESWARDNCALTCKYCVGPSTQAPPCVDVIDNCASYQADACTSADYKNWAQANCRRTCRMCPANVLAQLDALTTTMPPTACVDKLDCRLYGQSTCTGDYVPWAKQNCIRYCGFCSGVATTSKPCLDVRPNCDQYDKDMCTNPSYTIWVDDNCPQYCNRCPGGSGGNPMPQTSAPGYVTPPPLGK